MEKISATGAGIALAVTAALLNVVCALAFTLWPEGTTDFFGAFAHGLDFTTVKAALPPSPGRVLYGAVGLAVVGFVTGAVFATVYNLTTRR